MQRLEVSGAVRPIYGSLGVKRLTYITICMIIPYLRLIIIVSHLETQIFVPQQVTWDLWWTKRHLNRFLSGHFGLSLLVSFYSFSTFSILSFNDRTRDSVSKRECHPPNVLTKTVHGSHTPYLYKPYSI
jgi:hypothetical protein